MFKKYTMRVVVQADIEVTAQSVDDATNQIANCIDGNEANFGAWLNGDPILATVTLADRPIYVASKTIDILEVEFDSNDEEIDALRREIQLLRSAYAPVHEAASTLIDAYASDTSLSSDAAHRKQLETALKMAEHAIP